MRLVRRLAFAAVILGFGAGLAWAQTGWWNRTVVPDEAVPPAYRTTSPSAGNTSGGNVGAHTTGSGMEFDGRGRSLPGVQPGGNAGNPSDGNVSDSLSDYDVCELIEQLKNVFQILRILCFAGAAFMMMGWAWGYITNPETVKMDEAKKKGVGLIISFLLLFGVGTLMSYMPGLNMCPDVIW